jgi:hypothetical protein
MSSIKSILQSQFWFNQGSNLMDQEGLKQMHFSKELIRLIQSGDIPELEDDGLITGELTEMTLAEFFRVNQYYTFDRNAVNNLRSLYSDLLQRIRSMRYSIEELEREHYQGLADWLKKSQPFVNRLYHDKGARLTPVVCEEYSAAFQCHMLGMDPRNLLQPVLDLGCGKDARLVNYMREQSIEAYGCDRYPFDTPFLFSASWMEYHFSQEQWGTIISHMAFSNHFMHHHLRMDGDFSGYASKYMEILKALKFGGSFYYTPELPFIEQYLNPLEFNIEHPDREHPAVRSSCITRILVNE